MMNPQKTVRFSSEIQRLPTTLHLMSMGHRRFLVKATNKLNQSLSQLQSLHEKDEYFKPDLS